MKGTFITVEGGEGAGKTTVLNTVYEKLTDLGYSVILTREPGGIKISEKIREVILNPNYKEMEKRTEALLYAAARRQHLIEKVKPAIAAGKIVLCDRFIDSSLTYQGYARGIGIEEVLAINEFAIDGFMPSLTLYFDVKPEIGLNRIFKNEMRERNRLDLESLEFHNRVYEGYHILLKKFPNRIKRLDVNRPLEIVQKEAFEVIFSHIREYTEEVYK